MSQVHLSVADYIVMVAMLVVSLAIGFYFACTGGRQRTQREYLLAEGKMSFWPVCLSLFATFQSAIGLLGGPADVYEYGTMWFYNGISIALANLITAFTIVPLFHPLGLVSVYEYLELRYNSKIVRWIGVFTGMLWTIVYMAMALISPALALQGVTEIPIWMSVVVVAAIGTVYTSVGGMKTVLWTDVFQTAIIFAGLLAVIIKGVIEIGGVHELLTISQRGQRLEFDEVSPDPRVRHTLWGFLFGYTIYWFSKNLGQSAVQRISSTKSLRHAKLSFLTALPMNLFNAFLQVVAGLCMYAFFSHAGCDPLRAGYVTNSNQVIIYYVVNVLGFLPGFSGLYLATIISGSLSTLSSGLNSLAANTTEDLLRRPLSKLSPACVTKVTKVIALLFGCVITGIAYSFRSLKGPMTQLTIAALGAANGPLGGLFIMGFVFPQANKIGAITGSVIAFTFNMWMSLSIFMYGACKPKKPAGSLYGCPEYNSSSALLPVTADPFMYLNETTSFYGNESAVVETTSCDVTAGFFLYNISYLWYTLIGCIICVAIGLAVSLITNIFIQHHYPASNLLLPLVRRGMKNLRMKSEQLEVKENAEELELMKP
ncbi:sodium-dependent multivitamin transporter-like [Pomacea canaliculata]|uniref:sodium-dependent multivitamin transporter-like n=1 Tax=Pomacea canaliculata TaxID=400727 RepID=UPI000D726761|nr:sodium-dependent multivitamin transporter-like [Pomacea canaliculata]